VAPAACQSDELQARPELLESRSFALRTNVAHPPHPDLYAYWERGTRQMSDRRELYRSPSGDAWFLAREPTDGRAFIIHQPNSPSGGRLAHIDLVTFLSNEAKGPEQQALLRLIGTLVDVPPYADRT